MATPVSATILLPPTTATSKGGTITLGGTAQVAAVQNGNRRGLILQNPVAAIETLFFSFSGTATTASLSLAPGSALVLDAQSCPTSALSVLAATTGHAFACEEFTP